MGLCGGEGSEEREREWEEAAEAVAYDSCTWPPPVVAVCGPGNSGKSAFSRLLLNTLIGSLYGRIIDQFNWWLTQVAWKFWSCSVLLVTFVLSDQFSLLFHSNRYKRVAYLDTDVGQPEFTPPGFVSLHVLEEQTKDLTMLYLRPPKRCFFFGDVGAHSNPKLLLSYLFGLYDYFLQELYCFNETDNPQKSAIPLVINTSGWVKGIGLHVLSEILRYVSPTDVIRLCSPSEGKNLPDGAFWLDGHQGDSRVNLIVIRASQNSPRHLLVKKEARMIRDLRLIAYFRQCLPRDFPVFSCDDLVQGFSAIDPFQLPLSKIQVSGGAVYDFLNGTIVGLGSSTCLPLSSECSSPWCIGLAICIDDVGRVVFS
ncbi:hypothetical protein QYE76_062976 [Lolium multiflorum]|uniref:Clp1 P-loop domain-containing protein n=1 Tax=Lolium multiflorum TaxID=4521 RepID=A0AAD8S3P2_LOLMU|nr:hypothetical protein QYE76_062976 [Lolium multiflorum]